MITLSGTNEYGDTHERTFTHKESLSYMALGIIAFNGHWTDDELNPKWRDDRLKSIDKERAEARKRHQPTPDTLLNPVKMYSEEQMKRYRDARNELIHSTNEPNENGTIAQFKELDAEGNLTAYDKDAKKRIRYSHEELLQLAAVFHYEVNRVNNLPFSFRAELIAYQFDPNDGIGVASTLNEQGERIYPTPPLPKGIIDALTPAIEGAQWVYYGSLPLGEDRRILVHPMFMLHTDSDNIFSSVYEGSWIFQCKASEEYPCAFITEAEPSDGWEDGLTAARDKINHHLQNECVRRNA